MPLLCAETPQARARACVSVSVCVCVCVCVCLCVYSLIISVYARWELSEDMPLTSTRKLFILFESTRNQQCCNQAISVCVCHVQG